MKLVTQFVTSLVLLLYNAYFRPNSGSLDEVPNSLLLKLLESGIKGCSDSDKIRVNTVRALGNFLLLVSSDLMENDKFKAATMCAIDVLVQNSSSGSNMKVIGI